ncbi:hypothetical protein [Haloquadratum walsbyi]|jgi:hypothetical protein|uniref:hypothetical protein n=1 Tax=Haloquadratum walsbyi TaxID=293091 RepID=UPI0015F55D2B|nr:hypothetical protein [Haloquadratum walsbyi]
MSFTSDARSAEQRDESFLLTSAVIGVIGCLLAGVTPLIGGSSTAFTGSIVSSSLLGLVFAVQSLRLLRRDGVVALAPAVLTTIFGGWFMAAPLLYDVGFIATAGTQFAGLLLAAFGLYLTLARIAPSRGS